MINYKLTTKEKNVLWGIRQIFSADICEGIQCHRHECQFCPLNSAVKAHEIFLSELEKLATEEEE